MNAVAFPSVPFDIQQRLLQTNQGKISLISTEGAVSVVELHKKSLVNFCLQNIGNSRQKGAAR